MNGQYSRIIKSVFDRNIIIAQVFAPKEEASASAKASASGAAALKSYVNDAPSEEVKCPIKGCRFSSSNPVERDHHVKVTERLSYFGKR